MYINRVSVVFSAKGNQVKNKLVLKLEQFWAKSQNTFYFEVTMTVIREFRYGRPLCHFPETVQNRDCFVELAPGVSRYSETLRIMIRMYILP